MAVGLSHKICSKLIIVVTDSGRMARLVAMFRPNATVLAVTKLNSVARELTLIKNLSVI